jgi:photosystem II stability/assembly factor-like uncharacterized protein
MTARLRLTSIRLSGRLAVQVARIGTALLAAPVGVSGQGKPADEAHERVKAFDTHLEMMRKSPFGALSWSFLGPTNISGRANDVAVADRNGKRRIYVAFDGGGLWKTDDTGRSWQATFTRAASTAITTVAVAPSNPDVVWLLTGASNRARPVTASVGVFKSEDGGRTWAHKGLDQVGAGGYGRIVVHPTDPNVVYVAAQGGPRPGRDRRGVFKTTDGGRTWVSVFARGPHVGVSGLVMDPTDPGTLYAATRWRPRGTEPPLAMTIGDSIRPSIFKSTNGGASWTEIATGLPEPKVRGSVDVAIARSQPQVLYALVNNLTEAGKARAGEINDFGLPASPHRKGPEVYRSDNAGASWKKMSPDAEVANAQDHWVAQLRVDPTDPSTVYMLGQSNSVSHDSGRTMRSLWMGHADHNGLWIDPANHSVLYDAGDGGLFMSEDGGLSGARALVPTSQFYDIELDSAAPFRVHGAVQDMSSFWRAVDLRQARAIAATEFENGVGGEVTYHAADPRHPDVVYAASGLTGARLYRHDLSHWWKLPTEITPHAAPGEPRLRGAWLFPIVLSPHDPNTLYVGYQYLYRSRDRGDHWERISGDLTDNGSPELQILDYSNQAISTISESPLKRGLIYGGSDDGRLHVTSDDGKTWTELTARLPRKLWVSRVVASGRSEGTVYVMQRGREGGDFSAYLYRSDDAGTSFTNMAGDIPAGPVNVVREDPFDAKRIYAGTDFGVYATIDGGTHWDVVGGNLPTVPVTDLQIHRRDKVIVISTYGAGVWALDATSLGSAPRSATGAASLFRDPRETAIAGTNVRKLVSREWPEWVDLALLVVLAITVLATLVCFGWILVRIKRRRGVWRALAGLVFAPYAYAWGWLDARRSGRRWLMIIWTGCAIVALSAMYALSIEFG